MRGEWKMNLDLGYLQPSIGTAYDKTDSEVYWSISCHFNIEE